jgi:hypothetical protein
MNRRKLVLALLTVITMPMTACSVAASSTSPTQLPSAAASQSATAMASVEPPQLTVTLGESGCAVGGQTTAVAGPVVIGLQNDTGGRFDLDLWRLDDGHEYDELEAHIAEEMRRVEAGEEPLGHPTFADLVAEATAEGASGELHAVLEAGTYGFACIAFDTPAAPSGIWATGPLTVS